MRRWAGEQLSSAGRCRLLKNGTVVKCCLIDDSEDDYALCATERGTVLTCACPRRRRQKEYLPITGEDAMDPIESSGCCGHGALCAVTCLAAHPSSNFFRDVRFRQQSHHLGRR